MREKSSIYITILLLFSLLTAQANEPADDQIIHDVSVLSSSNNICYNERGASSILVKFKNTGTEVVSSAQFGWFLDNNQNGVVNWNGTSLPGQTVDFYISSVSFPSHGDFNLQVWNSYSDDNAGNDSVNLIVEVGSEISFDLVNDTSVCPGDSIQLSIPSEFSSFQWSNNAQSSTVSLSQPGSYVVTVTDSIGCVAVDSFSILNFSGPESLLPNDTVLCTGEVFSPVVPNGFASFSWGGNGVVDSSGVASEGQYILTVVDSNQCVFTDSFNISLLSVPTPTLPNYVNVCQGDTADLSISSHYVSYLWSTGDTVSTIHTNLDGVFHVTVTGSNGCLGFDSVEVQVKELPVVEFYDTLMCDLEPIVIGIGWFNSYNWSTGDNSQFPMVSSPGWYYVTVTDENNCESNDSIEVLNQNVNLSLGPDIEFCNGDGEFILLGHFDSYLWNNGDTTSVHWLGEPGIHSVTVSKGFCTVSDEILVEEIPYPLADFSEVVVSPEVEFTNMSNVQTGLTWDFGDGTFSNSINPVHEFLNTGVYTVALTAQNRCDTSTFSKTVSIFPQAAANSLIHNGQISVFPTITSDVINLNLRDLKYQDIQYTVFDGAGKLLIYNQVVFAGGDENYVLDISAFASGSYYIRVEGESFDPQVSSIIKK